MVNRLLVAGGGTGGHLFPGVAVAEEVRRRNPNADVLFVGTGRPVEVEVFRRLGLASRKITAMGLKGKTLWERVRALAAVPVGLFQSAGIVMRFKPDMVLGVGGYSSGPVCLAARIMGYPTAIHEQNSVPGLTNRLLGRVVNLIFISFESARSFFPAAKTHLTGNPIRREIAEATTTPAAPQAGGLTVLVVGGSQGAHAVNQAVIEAMRLLGPERDRFTMIHQTGTADVDAVRSAYRDLNMTADVRPFIQEMGVAYQAADLVVSRAGALTVAEVAAMGRAAIFVPLPTAANNHQEINARSLVEAGAAEIILQKDLTPERLAERIRSLAEDRDRLQAMGRAAREAARPEAAAAICDLCRDFLHSRVGRE